VARIRSIKPEFPQSESMGNVSRDARLCFVLMWTIADDSGRLRGNSRMIASLLFPYDNDAPGLVDGWLAELEREGCVNRYMVDGSTYIEIAKWLSHQKIDKPSQSKIPQFDESSRIIANVRGGIKDQGSKDQGEDQGKRAPRSQAVACPLDVDPQVWDDWLKLRKTKRAPVTETVVSGAQDEANKAGMTLESFLRVWCRRGSQGLEAAWLKPDERQQSSETPYQRSQRLRVAEFAPSIAKADPSACVPASIMEVFDVSTRRLG